MIANYINMKATFWYPFGIRSPKPHIIMNPSHSAIVVNPSAAVCQPLLQWRSLASLNPYSPRMPPKTHLHYIYASANERLRFSWVTINPLAERERFAADG